MDTLGAIVGPAIAITVLYLFGVNYNSAEVFMQDSSITEYAFRTIFWLSILPGLAAVILIIFFVREKLQPSDPGSHRKLLSLSFTDVNFRKFLFVVSIFTLGNFSNAFIILKIQDVGGSLLNVTTLYLLFNAVYSVSSLPAGIAADYFGKKRMILSSYILFGLIYAGFAFAVSQATVWILFLLYGIFMGVSEGQQRAFVATLLPDNAKGTGYGVYHTVIGLITLPSSFIAGLLWDIKGPQATFLFGTATAIIASILFLIYFIPSAGRGRRPGSRHQDWR